MKIGNYVAVIKIDKEFEFSRTLKSYGLKVGDVGKIMTTSKNWYGIKFMNIDYDDIIFCDKEELRKATKDEIRLALL